MISSTYKLNHNLPENTEPLEQANEVREIPTMEAAKPNNIGYYRQLVLYIFDSPFSKYLINSSVSNYAIDFFSAFALRTNIFGIQVTSCVTDAFKKYYEDTTSKVKKIFYLVNDCRCIINLISTNLFRTNLVMNIAMKSFGHFIDIKNNIQAISIGINKIRSYMNEKEQLSTKKKVECIALGCFLIGLGIFGLARNAQNLRNFYSGLRAYTGLDPTQKYFALKHGDLEYLGKNKELRAIVIDGSSSDWSRIPTFLKNLDNSGSPLTAAVYQNYNVRTYRANSGIALADVLRQGASELQGKINLLVLEGHANNRFIRLNSDYGFFGTAQEIRAIQHSMSDFGKVFLAGCSTAKEDRGEISITRLLSKKLPNLTFVGFSENLCPLLSSASFKNNTVLYNAYSGFLNYANPRNLWNPKKSSMTRVFINGTSVGR